jgi:hypothetical protein
MMLLTTTTVLRLRPSDAPVARLAQSGEWFSVCFRQGCAICSSVEGILAVIAFLELALNPFRSPNLSARSLGMFPKMLIPVLEMPVDGSLRRIERMVIAIVDYRSCHTAENRLDDVEKLSPGW